MWWILKKVCKVLIILIILGLIGGVVLLFVVDPDNFKSHITDTLQKTTGQAIQINGEISWSIRPHTTINMKDLVLTKGFDDNTPVLQIKEAIVNIDLFSLLKSVPIIEKLTLNNLTIDWVLAKNLSMNPNNNLHKLLIASLQIKNGSIKLEDSTDHINWLLQNINLSANNIMLNRNKEFPSLQISGDLINLDRNITYKIDTIVKIDLNNDTLILDPLKMLWNNTQFTGTATIAEYLTNPIISGDMAMDKTDVASILQKVDPYYANNSLQVSHSMQMQMAYSYQLKNKILDLTKIDFKLDNGSLNGNCRLGIANPYNAEFALTADNLNLAPLTLVGAALFPTVHTMSSFPADLFQDLSIKGSFAGTNISYNDAIKVDQVNMEVSGGSGVIQLAPVLISAYGGTHNIIFNLDVINKQQPYFELSDQASKIKLNNNIISGDATIKASLNAMGNDMQGIKQTLNGSVNLYVNDGVLRGIDIDRVMELANNATTDVFYELTNSPAAKLNVLAIKGSSDIVTTQQDNPETNFNSFALQTTIKAGIAKNTNVTMGNKAIALKGSGEFSLLDKNVNMSATIANNTDVVTDSVILSQYMKQTAVDMSITGTITSPVFGPTVYPYIMNVIKAAQLEISNQAVAKMIAATPTNLKTDKSASTLFIDSLQSLAKQQ